MIQGIQTVWLYAYSPQVGRESKTYYTVYMGRLLGESREVMATTSLSYLTSLNAAGAGTLIKNYRTRFGALHSFTDFAMNSVYVPDAIAVTFGLSANGAEAYAQGNLFYLS
jgi:hypothetical protein